jgi:NAD(P)-dependent dehydrogenase (short-subunit alcohol dehydrogenase family)
VIRVNLRGTFLCCRAAFKQMKKQGGGDHQCVECRRSPGLGRHWQLQRFKARGDGADESTG